MAGTYYKYAEQSADSYINWAEIGKNMTDMLAQEKKIREDKRAALDESSRQYGEQLSEPPQGDSKSLNQYSLEFANQAQQNRLLQDRLFKSGRLKQKDYLVNRQNLEDGTKNLYSVLKEYNAEFKDKMERANSQDPSKKSQYAEQWLMENIEGFANFNTSAAYINPTDGTISIAMKEKKMVNGKEVYVMSDNPDKFASIASLRNRLKNKYDYYDTPKQIGAMVDGWGSEINSFVQSKNSLGATGTIAEALDITKRENLPTDPVKLKLAFTEAQKKGFKGTQEQWVSNQNNLKQVAMGFEQAETKMLDSQLANSWNVSSVLTNTLTAAPNGLPYKFTWNPKERDANPNLILMKEGPNGPELDFTGKVGEEQYNQARERLRLEARMQYDKKVELKVTPQTESRYAPEYVARSREEAKTKQTAAGYWNQLFTGKTASEKLAAADVLMGTPEAIKKELMKIDLSTPGKVKLIYKNSDNNRIIDMEDDKGNPISLADFASKGVELHGVEDRDKAMKAGGGGKTYGKLNSTEYTNISALREGAIPKPKPQTPFEIYASNIDNLVGNVSKDEDEAYESLNKSLSSIGASVSIPYTFGNYIVVKAPNGKESEKIKLDDPAAAKEAISNWVKSNPKGESTALQESWINSLQQSKVLKSTTTVDGGNVR